MLTLNDGRSELWQWDTGRKLTVDAECSQVHFSNKVFGRSIDVDVVGGIAIIPDSLLQTDKDLIAWAFVGTPENGYTKISKTFKVNRRNKPADYVFTPTEQTTLAEIMERIDDLEAIQDPDAIKNAVEDYLEQNPVEVPVQSVNGQTGEVELTADDVGALPDNTKIPEEYKLPVATANTHGGIKAEPATEDDTQPVRIGEDGMLYTAPGSGGGDKWETIVDYTVPEDCVQVFLKTDISGNPFKLKEAVLLMVLHPLESGGTPTSVRCTVDGTVDGTVNGVYNANHYTHGFPGTPEAGKYTYVRMNLVSTPNGVWLREYVYNNNGTANANGLTGGRTQGIHENIHIDTLQSPVKEISAVGLGSYGVAVGKGTRIVMVGVRE